MTRRALARVALLLVGGITLVVGITGLTNPRALMAPVGIALEAPAALGEARANYGGMHTAMGLFFLAASFIRRIETAALVVVALFVGGLATGRLTSVLVDGWPGPLAALLVVAEAGGAALAVAALAARAPDEGPT
jgi:hypothetical protein